MNGYNKIERAKIIRNRPDRITISSILSLKTIPSVAFFANFTLIIKQGSEVGKDKIGTITLFWFDLSAIAVTKVKTKERQLTPKKIARIYSHICSTGLPSNKEKQKKLTNITINETTIL